GLERARARGIETFVVSPKDHADRRAWDEALAAAVALGATGAVLHVQGLDAFRGNLEAKYGYTAVDRIRQSGPGFVADLTQADGTVLRDEMVLLESSGEPVVGEDILARPVETR
ncbi:hypothetical protein LB570_30955, partial [Mesorhizobium sp. BR1-1-5]|nr:hypothetical protein [Mesorhizobium sp. BR1-1-5]